MQELGKVCCQAAGTGTSLSVAVHWQDGPTLIAFLDSVQAEALEAENRLLQEINVRQEAQISALELENVELKDESRHHERERRIVVSRVSMPRNFDAYMPCKRLTEHSYRCSLAVFLGRPPFFTKPFGR